jgi:osmotically inducible protein OsmC
MDVVYSATATTDGSGRAGKTSTSDGKLSLQLAFPKEVGGTGDGTNPEQLAALGYSACFGSALALVAQAHGVDARHATTSCTVQLHKSDGDFSLSFSIEADLPGVEKELADVIVAQAHAKCPYSRAFGHGAPTSAHLRS